MNGNPNVSGTRQPPQPYQQPNINEFRREVPDVSLVFNPDERSLVLPLLPSDRQHQQNLLHRSRSVPGRISDPARPPPQPVYYRTPPPRPTQESQGSGRISPVSSVPPQRPSPVSSVPQRPSSASSIPPRPSPLTRPASVATTATAYTDASSSHEDGGEGLRAAVSSRRTPSVESPAAVSPRSAGSAASPASSWAGGVNGGGAGGGSTVSVPPEPSCCGAELRAVLRLVADNGRQLQQLRAQVRQLLNRPPAVAEATAPPRNVLLREAQTQTERDSPPRRPVMTAAAVNTSFSLTPRRDVGTDPPPAPSPAPPPAPLADSGPARQFVSERPIGAEVTGSAGRENTAQVQRRRVQEWVEGEGWAEEQEPELTLRGLELPTVPEQPPTPEASVHVDMPVYQPSPGGSCDGSVADDAETERPRRPDTTFFQNVMGQVNQILDGAARGESAASADGSGGSQTLSASPVLRHPRDDDELIRAEPDPVRRATLQQLRAAGVSFAPTQADDESMLDYSCPPRAVRAAASVPCSTDLSLEMNTLAMKYVDSRQLMQRAAAVGGRPAPHPVESRLLGKENLAPPSRGRPTDMTMYGISDSNMSFSTRKYMEKFNLQS